MDSEQTALLLLEGGELSPGINSFLLQYGADQLNYGGPVKEQTGQGRVVRGHHWTSRFDGRAGFCLDFDLVGFVGRLLDFIGHGGLFVHGTVQGVVAVGGVLFILCLWWEAVRSATAP